MDCLQKPEIKFWDKWREHFAMRIPHCRNLNRCHSLFPYKQTPNSQGTCTLRPGHSGDDMSRFVNRVCRRHCDKDEWRPTINSIELVHRSSREATQCGTECVIEFDSDQEVSFGHIERQGRATTKASERSAIIVNAVTNWVIEYQADWAILDRSI